MQAPVVTALAVEYQRKADAARRNIDKAVAELEYVIEAWKVAAADGDVDLYAGAFANAALDVERKITVHQQIAAAATDIAQAVK